MSIDSFGRLATVMRGLTQPRQTDPVMGTITSLSPLTVDLDTGQTIVLPAFANGRPQIPGGSIQFLTEGEHTFEVPPHVFSMSAELIAPGLTNGTDATGISFGAILDFGIDVVPGDTITAIVGGSPAWLGKFHEQAGGSNGGADGGNGVNNFGSIPDYVPLHGVGGCGSTDLSVNGDLKGVAGGGGGGWWNTEAFASGTWQDMEAFGGWGGGREYWPDFDPPDYYSGSAGSSFFLPSSTSGGHGGSDIYGGIGGDGDAYGDPGDDGTSGSGGRGGNGGSFPSTIILGGSGGGGGHTGGGGGGHDASFGGGGGGGGSFIYDEARLGVFGTSDSTLNNDDGGIWKRPGRISLSWGYPRCHRVNGARVLCIPLDYGHDWAILCP